MNKFPYFCGCDSWFEFIQIHFNFYIKKNLYKKKSPLHRQILLPMQWARFMTALYTELTSSFSLRIAQELDRKRGRYSAWIAW